MNFMPSHPDLMWLYYGVFGSADIALLVLTMWSAMLLHRSADRTGRWALRSLMVGFAFLFVSGWWACGIGGPPGNLLSADEGAHNLAAATASAALAMAFSVPGWAGVAVGLYALFRRSEVGKSAHNIPSGVQRKSEDRHASSA